MDQRFRLERESNVFITDGRKHRIGRGIPEELRDGGIADTQPITGVEDGIARAQLESGFLFLGSAQLDVIELLHGTLVHGKSGGQLIEAQPHKCESASEGGEWLVEKRTLLALQLCQKSGDGFTAGVLPRGISWLIRSEVCPPMPQRGHRNIEKIELVGDVQPNIPRVSMAHLEDFQIEKYFRPRTVQLSKKLGCGFQRPLRPAHCDRAGCGVTRRELEFKERP